MADLRSHPEQDQEHEVAILSFFPASLPSSTPRQAHLPILSPLLQPAPSAFPLPHEDPRLFSDPSATGRISGRGINRSRAEEQHGAPPGSDQQLWQPQESRQATERNEDCDGELCLSRGCTEWELLVALPPLLYPLLPKGRNGLDEVEALSLT